MDKNSTQPLFNILSKFCWALAAIALVLVVISLFTGDDLVLPWNAGTTYVKSPLFLEYFTIGGKQMGFELDQIINWQQFKTGRYLFLEWPEYILFSLLIISYAVITLSITYLERFWYLVCAGIMVFISINLGLEELGVLSQNLAYIFIGLFLFVSYYFQSIRPQTGFTTRLVSITVAFALFTIACIYFSPLYDAPLIWFSFGLFAPLLLAALYVFFIAGDNFFFLFKIATQNAPSGKNGLIHFLSIGAIYILVLVLLFLNLTGEISLDLILIDPYLILILSTISGYYALSHKLEVVETDLPLRLIKHVLYPTLTALTLALVFYAEITANDSLILAIQMCIVISHLAFASVYYIYCFMNFTPGIMAKEAVWKSFFKGERAPLLTARLGVIVFIIGTLYFLNFKPYHQIQAARYNALGAVAEKTQNDLLASQYYKQALFYDFASVKANYSQAMIEKANGNSAQSIKRFKEAQLRSENHKPLLTLTQYYTESDQLFNKLLTLKEIKNPYADEKVINSLAIAHFEFGHLDTALFMLEKAYELRPSETITSNFLALDLAFQESIDIDSVLKQTEDYSEYKTLMNRQALANKKQAPTEFQLSQSKDSLLLMDELYYLYNTAIGPANNDPKILEALNYYLPFPRNFGVKDYLLLGKTIQLYNQGQVNEAFMLLNDMIASYNRNAGLYSFIKSIWAYQQGAFDLSIVYLADAHTYNFDKTIIGDAFESLKTRQIDQQPIGMAALWQEYETQKAEIDSSETTDLLMKIATTNAFDGNHTLKAIEVLKQIGLNPDTIYELLQKAIRINSRSVVLYEAYIDQSVENGLSFFGQSALKDLQKFASPEKYDEIEANFHKKLEKRRHRDLLESMGSTK